MLVIPNLRAPFFTAISPIRRSAIVLGSSTKPPGLTLSLNTDQIPDLTDLRPLVRPSSIFYATFPVLNLDPKII
jgi:hypothetical protein